MVLAPNQALGWGLLRRFPPFRYFPNFSTSPKYMLAIEYHVHIWQVSPQLSCGDTCQIWMRFKECNRYFCQIENFAYGEIDERNFRNPHPWPCLWRITSHKRLRLPPTLCSSLPMVCCLHHNVLLALQRFLHCWSAGFFNRSRRISPATTGRPHDPVTINIAFLSVCWYHTSPS